LTQRSGLSLGPRFDGWLDEPLRLRLLMSYFYYRTFDMDELLARHFVEPYPEIFADSGAFSADSQGKHITIREYADWVHRWKHLFSGYANLDVIGDQDATMENQHRLEDLGLTPLPTITLGYEGSDYDLLDEIADSYGYLALGGRGPHKHYTKKIMRHLIRCFKVVQGRAKIHGFGVTSWIAIKALPWYSVDSTTWVNGFKFGKVSVFDPRNGKWYVMHFKDRAIWRRYASLIRWYGYDPADFAGVKVPDRRLLGGLAVLSYMVAERWLAYWRQGTPPTKIHTVVGWDSENEGKRKSSNASLQNVGNSLKLFLADMGQDQGSVASEMSRLTGQVEVCGDIPFRGTANI